MAESTSVENELKPPDEPEQYNVSIQALRSQTKNLLSALLNPHKIFLSDEGLPRDWHGLSQLVGIGGERIPHLQCGSDPTKTILNLWYQDDKEGATIKKLLEYLEQLDRFDIIDDAKPFIEEDIKVFGVNSKVVEQVSVDFDADNYILTRDDLVRAEEGLQPQTYDAFVLFADDDIDFATQLIDKLENQYKLKLCVKDRDLVVGVFEHESVIKLIAERCNRMVAIISSAFLASASNKFFCSFAQTLGIDQRRRKIVPCLYSTCQIPPELSCYFMLDYRRAGLGNFWERLKDSIRTPNSAVIPKQSIYRSASQKIPQNNSLKQASQFESNSLKPKKEGVKFSSMVNLNHPENDNVALDQNLNPSCSATSLSSVTIENKKSKTRVGWLKKLLPHKNDKYNSNVIVEVPERHKKSFWTKNIKRKVAVAN